MVRVYHPLAEEGLNAFFSRVDGSSAPSSFALPWRSILQFGASDGASRSNVYVRLVEPTAGGTTSKEGHIEQVYSPDHATAFTYGDAQFYRQKAFERWSNYDWEIEKLGGDKYRVRANRLAHS